MEKVVGFDYRKTPVRYVAKFVDGKWQEGYLTEDETITLNESACVFQYAQTVFEGLKAYRTKDGKVVCFRPDLNAERLADSCARMKIPPVSKEVFLDAVEKVVAANADYVPEYGTGASLYLRPFVFGTNPVLGVKPASEYEFRLFASPVGAYFSGEAKPIKIRLSELDRAAPRGTGHIKAGLNYAMSLYNIVDAHEKGYDENLYLDSATRTYIEETGGANILFITKDNKVVTPLSDTILPSITRRSLMYLAEHVLHLEVEQRKISIDELGDFVQCGLTGTAAVISPVGEIHAKDKVYTYQSEFSNSDGVLGLLYNTLLQVQKGELEAPEGWVKEIC